MFWFSVVVFKGDSLPNKFSHIVYQIRVVPVVLLHIANEFFCERSQIRKLNECGKQSA